MIMDRYEISCTEEQTRRALKLGAPIETYEPRIIDSKAGGSFTLPTIETVTASQMIGWLEEQGINIVIGRFFAKWAFKLEKITDRDEENLHIDAINLPSRKEATLAAIDAALDYLTENKKY